MPSVESVPPAPRTLAGRLAWTLTLSATVAATVALGTTMLLGDMLVVDSVEHSVRDEAAVLAAEIEEKPSMVEDIEYEARELGIDMRVAVTRNGHRVAGDQAVGVADARPCTHDDEGEIVCRRALVSDPTMVVHVAAPAERVHGHRGPLAIAAALVLVVVLAGAGFFGVTVARRVLAPVERLRKTVADVDASSPAAVHLPPPTDLAELDALRSALANLLGRLDAELSRTRTFAANAAHELRTPLTKIQAELELAMESEGTDSSGIFYRLRQTTARLATLLERLLLLATPQEVLKADTQGTSMSALAEDLVDSRDPDERARLRIETADDDGLVRGDPVLLAAVLDNVVDNALKFSDGPVTVIVHEDPGAARVRIDVDDEGPGVPEDRATELFEPFARDPAARLRPGHGLGLALCAHVVRAYGGAIQFMPGRVAGARLRIDLPLAG